MYDKQVVLLVDDAGNAAVQQMFDAVSTVIRVDSSAAAQAYLAVDSAITVVFIHITKSMEDALSLLNAVRERRFAEGLAVGIAFSAYEEASIARALSLGANELVFLPASGIMLTHHANKLLALAHSHSGSREIHQLMDDLYTGIGIFEYIDGHVRILYMNRMFLYGAKMAFGDVDSFQSDILSALDDETADTITAALEAHQLDDRPIDLSLHLQLADGDAMSVTLRALPIRYTDKASPVFLANITDVTTQTRAEQALAQSHQQLESLMDAVPGGIAVYELANGPKLLYSNQVLHNMCGYGGEEYHQIMSEDYHKLIVPEDRPIIDRLINSFCHFPQHMEETFRVLTKGGEHRWMHVSISPVGDGSRCNAVFIDVTQAKENEAKGKQMLKELAYRAEHDTLTGISNREAFYQKTSELIHDHPDETYAILVLDIDRFKIVNDMFGKEAGDRVLVAIADGLAHFLRNVGTYSRMEADHFAACFPTRLLDMERIQHMFDIGLKRQKIDYHIQLSFGVYLIHDIAVPVNHMCDRAAMAMKTVKGNVLRRYAYYDDQLRQTLLDETAIQDEMYTALDQGQFVVYLQPIFAVDTQLPVSAEALVRWDHPIHGMIPPYRFIPLFERNGFITKLDFYIWEKACALLSEWEASGYPLPISVNISRVDLYHPRLCDYLLELTERYHIKPSSLRLEITESAYSKDPEELVKVIEALRALGFMILMDDFGSGYSSLNVLMDMPVDMLKLDMRFISKLDTNPRAASILTSVVRMAKWLHIPLVAEGVSSWEQLSFLRSIGCDSVQGFLFAKPMSIAEYTDRYIYIGLASRPILEDTAPEQALDLSFLWALGAQTEALFNGMIGAMGVYELDGDTLEVRRVNDGYYELFHCTPKQVFDKDQDALFSVHPDDRAKLFAACSKAATHGKTESCVCRHIRRNINSPMWLEARLRFMGKAGRNQVFFFTFSDVTEQKLFEQTRSLHNYAAVLRSLYSSVYELNITTQTFRAIYTSCSSDPDALGEKPLGKLKDAMARLIPGTDDELKQHIFTAGFLKNKLKKTQSDHCLYERKMTLSGQQRWASLTFIGLPTESAEDVYLLCIADIDNHKRAEQLAADNQWLQLKQAEQIHYQTTMEQLGTTLLEWDLPTGKITSSKGFDRYAVSSFDLRALTTYKDAEPFVYEADWPIFRHFVGDIIAYDGAAVTLRLLEHDGSPVWCRVMCSLILDGQGRVSRCIIALNLIDDQMKMRENYLDERTRFYAFADNQLVGLGIFETKENDQRILYLSNGYRAMLGYAPDEPMYDDSHKYFGVHEDDIPAFQQHTRHLLLTDESFMIEYRAYHKDGSIRWLRSSNMAYPSQTPDAKRIFAVIEDVTQLHSFKQHLTLYDETLPIGVGIYDAANALTVKENLAMQQLLPADARFALLNTDMHTASVQTKSEILLHVSAIHWHSNESNSIRVQVLAPGQNATTVTLLAYSADFEGSQRLYCTAVQASQMQIGIASPSV